MLSPATFRPLRQRHVAGEIYPQRNVAGEKLMGVIKSYRIKATQINLSHVGSMASKATLTGLQSGTQIPKIALSFGQLTETHPGADLQPQQGAIVLTNVDRTIVWETNTTPTDVSIAVLHNTGNLVLKNQKVTVKSRAADIPLKAVGTYDKNV
ncbi:putative receptor protein kinase ZmPK1 [Tanacetum coccineum]